MPIVRSYMCPQCAHTLTVTLASEEWDTPAPDCPRCTQNPMDQEFKPFGIAGHTARSKAEKVTENIMRNDYQVNNYQRDKYDPTPKINYQTSNWGVARETLEAALRTGRETRLKHGNGLEILQANLKSGAEPDLIEISKRRAMRIY